MSSPRRTNNKTKKKDPSVDLKSRGKASTCKKEMAELIYMVRGDENYHDRTWGRETGFDQRTELIKEVKEKLNDPQFVLKWLTSLLQKMWENGTLSDLDFANAQSVLQIIQCMLRQSDNGALNQGRANEIQVSQYSNFSQHKGKGVMEEIEASQIAKELNSQSMNKELNQILERGNNLEQLMKDTNGNVINPKMLNEVMNSWSGGAHNIEIQNWQSTFNYHPTHNQEKSDYTAPNQDGAIVIKDSHHVNGKDVMKEMKAGASQISKEMSSSMNEDLNQITAFLSQPGQSMKNANAYVITGSMLSKLAMSCSNMAHCGVFNLNNPDEVPCVMENGELTLNFPTTPVHSQENEEKQSKEVTLTIKSKAGRVAQIKLANPEMFDHRLIIDEDSAFEIPEEFLDTCTIKNYKVYKCNSDALTRILKNYPNVDKKLVITDPELQSYLMNSLAELYQKIENKKEELEQRTSKIEEIELNDLQSMIGDMVLNNLQSKIKDMEHNGLQLSWLQAMLRDVSAAKKSLEGFITDRDEARKVLQQKAEERKQQLAKIFKKQRI